MTKKFSSYRLRGYKSALTGDIIEVFGSEDPIIPSGDTYTLEFDEMVTCTTISEPYVPPISPSVA